MMTLFRPLLLALIAANLLGCCTIGRNDDLAYLLEIGATINREAIHSPKTIDPELVTSIYCDDIFDDKAMKMTGRFENLNTISLMISRVTDEGVSHVSKLSALRELRLYYSRVTNISLHHLSSLKSLAYLDLTGTAISDAGIKQLASLSSVKVVDLRSTQVTAAGIAQLQKLRPDMEIAWE